MLKKHYLALGAVLMGLGFSQVVVAIPQIILTDNEANVNTPVNSPANNSIDQNNSNQTDNNDNDFDNSQDFGQDQDQAFDDDQDDANPSTVPPSDNAPEQESGYNQNNGN
jgi:hypothetical protein